MSDGVDFDRRRLLGSAIITVASAELALGTTTHARSATAPGRQVAMYFAWSRPQEIEAPLGILEDRFPTLFELRRSRWPALEEFSDPVKFDQGIRGSLDNFQLASYQLFADSVASWTGNPVRRAERRTDTAFYALDAKFLQGVDTLIIVSLDSLRTQQHATSAEIGVIRSFLDDPNHTLFICPHHNIGNTDELPEDARRSRQELEFRHHGDPVIPARQCFSGFGTSLLEGIGVSVANRFGLRSAKMPNGSPAPLRISAELDRGRLLEGVKTFNRHPHLPHLERLGDSIQKLDVLAGQPIDPGAPPHPFTAGGRFEFDALLQSRPDVFPGLLLLCDATIWTSTWGGVDNLRRFWRNVAMLKRAS